MGLRGPALAFALAWAAQLPRAEAAPSDGDVARARSLFEAGGRAYDDARFDVALKAFQQAYEIAPRDGLLFSIAQAHRRLFTTTGDAAHHGEAVRLYREYISKSEKGARKADAVQALEELQARPPASSASGPTSTPTAAAAETQALVYVYSSTPSLVFSIDGGAPQPPDTVSVPPGKHKLKLSAPGFEDYEIEIEPRAGQLVPVSKDLEEKPGKLTVTTSDGADVSVDGRFVGASPLAAPLELRPGSHFIAATKVGRHTRSETIVIARGAAAQLDLSMGTTTQRDVAFVAFGAAGAALVASGVLAGFAIVNHQDARAIYDLKVEEGIDDSQRDAYNDARAAKERFVIASAATGGGAVALAVLGLGLMLADPPERALPPVIQRKDEAPSKPKGPSEADDLARGAEAPTRSTGTISWFVAPAVTSEGFEAHAFFVF